MGKVVRALMVLPFLLIACSGGSSGGDGGVPGSDSAGGGESGGGGGGGDPVAEDFCAGPEAQGAALCRFVLIEQTDGDTTSTFAYDESGRKVRVRRDTADGDISDRAWTYFKYGEYSVENIFNPGNVLPDVISSETVEIDDYGRPATRIQTKEYFDDAAGSPTQKRLTVYDYSIPGTANVQGLSMEIDGGVTTVTAKEESREIYDASGALIYRGRLMEHVDIGGSTYQFEESAYSYQPNDKPLVKTRNVYDCDLKADCPGAHQANVVGDPLIERQTYTYGESGLATQSVVERFETGSGEWILGSTCTYQYDEFGNETVKDCDGNRTESTWQRLYEHLGVEPN